MTGLKKVAWWLVVIGALNWGLVALNASWDVVALIGGGVSGVIARIIYGLVGLSGLYLLFTMNK